MNLPPPPIQPTSNDRVLYDWLYALYAELIGQTGNVPLEMDTSGAIANAAAARAAAAERLAADAVLLAAPVQEVRENVIPAAPVPVIDARALVQESLLLMPPPIPPERYYVRALSADYDLRLNEFADVDASGGDVTITLPSSSSNAGRVCGVAKNDSSGNSVIVSGNINGDTSATITVQYTALWFISVGSEWRAW